MQSDDFLEFLVRKEDCIFLTGFASLRTGWNTTITLCRIFFSKETWFLLSGHLSGQNSRVLSNENRPVFVPALTSQNSWCVVRFHMFECPEHSSSRT
jgi:hypothetical protein